MSNPSTVILERNSPRLATITFSNPPANVTVYSDAGHAFLFQHLENFTAEVKAFLHD